MTMTKFCTFYQVENQLFLFSICSNENTTVPYTEHEHATLFKCEIIRNKEDNTYKL